jgi:hypothetical protein
VGNPVIADFNGDGILDVMLGGASGIWFFQGKGGGTFDTGVLVTQFPGATCIASADFNGDGNLDLAVCSSAGLSVLFGNGNGTFEPPQAVANTAGYQITAADAKRRRIPRHRSSGRQYLYQQWQRRLSDQCAYTGVWAKAQQSAT